MSGRQRSILSYFQETCEKLKTDESSPKRSVDICTKWEESEDSTCRISSSPKTTMLTRKRRLPSLSPIPDCSASVNSSFTASDAEKENERSFMSLDSSTATDQTLFQSFCSEQEVTDYVHFSLEFLKPNKIRDAQLRRPTDKDYDCSTLYVPDQFIQEQTPAMKLWWKMKAQHFDTLLFFKVGKFYELYHMDAVEAVRELRISFMKGSIAHCGFPEMVCQKYMDQLARRHYKVARIEQTESVQALSERISKLARRSKDDRVVRREICEIVTPGTRCSTADETLQIDGYLYSISDGQEVSDPIGFAACSVETGQLVVGSIPNDVISLHTLLARLPPKQVLLASDSTLKEQLNDKQCFVELLHKDKVERSLTELTTANLSLLMKNGLLPPALENLFLLDKDRLVVRDKSNSTTLKAFAMLTYYLRVCKIDDSILSRRTVSVYNEEYNVSFRKHMSLDAVTLQSLAVVRGNCASLEEIIDFCCTKAGKKLLRRWLLQPSCDVQVINERLDLVEAIVERNYMFNDVRCKMKRLPDIERNLMSIHSMSSNGKRPDHPDLRAVMADEEIVSKTRIKQFVQIIDGLSASLEIIEECSNYLKDMRHNMLTAPIVKLLKEDPASRIRSFKNSINFEDSFNRGRILPSPGQIPRYDSVIDEIEELHKDLEAYRLKQCRTLGHNEIAFVESGRNRYCLEIPAHLTKNLPSSYKIVCSKRSSNRYLTHYIEEKLTELTSKETERDDLLSGCTREIFAAFDQSFDTWSTICNCIATIDVLQSMAVWKSNLCVACRPELLPMAESSQQVVLQIEQGAHPILCCKNEDFVRNDVNFVPTKNMMLITGPNMGGKSTLIRQVGLIAILCQMGMHVPAKSVRMTLCDAILTRIGICDRPGQGQSTFHVELTETEHILTNASFNSLALIDEFGRGTSTEEAQALAKAVIKYITDEVKCRTMFSTHFHALLSSPELSDKVQLAFMDFVMNADGEVAFLHKVREGSCDKSHALSVARLAGLPDELLREAERRSVEYDDECLLLSMFRHACMCNSTEQFDQLLQNRR